MKCLLLVLCFPFVSLAQTIHFEDDQILYKGVVSLPGMPENEIFSKLESSVTALAGRGNLSVVASGQSKLVATGAIPLNTPFHLIRTVHFRLGLAAEKGGYAYAIDSVIVSENRRGGKVEIKSGEDLLEGMEETGAAGEANEKLLNEIDMRFQKLVALIRLAIKGEKKKE